MDAILYDVKECAKALGIGARQITAMVTSGELPFVRVGKRVMFRVAALHEWAESREIQINNNNKEPTP